MARVDSAERGRGDFPQGVAVVFGGSGGIGQGICHGLAAHGCDVALTYRRNQEAAQLTVAANRVASFGRVHRTLHLLDHQESVEFKQYLLDLCSDLKALLFPDPSSRTIAVQSANFELPTALAIPLGFIVSELITNATKYTTGSITVRIVTTTPGSHSLSVLDDGPGLPEGWDPDQSVGIGISNTRERLRHLYGDRDQTFEIFSEPGKGVRVDLSMPFRDR